MKDPRRYLLDLIADPDHAYSVHASEIVPLQLQAAQDLFERRREQIPLVAKRADDAGVTKIRSAEDIVPLLFAHTVYKSYPQSFVDRGQWDRMVQWLDTLSVADVKGGVDVAGVKDVDDWIERLWKAGHKVIATSGSSGKCSFLNHTLGDYEMKKRHFYHSVGWPLVRPTRERPTFFLGPIKGPNSAVEAAQMNLENWGVPGKIYTLTDKPLLISDISRMAIMRKRMAEGVATPKEIADFEAEAARKSNDIRADMLRLADTILDMRHEPVYISGLWSQHMLLIQRARERGIGDGEFDPQSIIQAGGGVKGVALPPDYKEQVARFYGPVIRPAAYGMTEMAQLLPRCEAGRYHRAPGLLILVLDPAGERLLRAENGNDGLVEGRFAFLDLLYEGRWGGIITGDKVTIDFSDRCSCGRPGPTILDNISRFAELGEADHIGCAGTIDGYIRGALNA